MNSAAIRISVERARRLVVTKQLLAGDRPARCTPRTLTAAIRALPYVQWDPVSVVAPSHLLSLWARVGAFRTTDLDRLLWKQRRLLQHWIPFAAIVSAEHFPVYSSFMRRYPESLSDSWGAQRARARAFLAGHTALRRKVLASLRGGPLQLSQFEDHARTKRSAGVWEPSSAVSEMLWHLLMSGEVMVVGHEGPQNLWGLPGAFLPSSRSRSELSAEEAELEAAQMALRGLGIATPKEIHHYFIRGCYRDIHKTLNTLGAGSRIRRVVVEGLPLQAERYVHEEDLGLLEDLRADHFSPRTALLPPFDNMVYDQARGKKLFDFDYVREQFLPKPKRRFGTWVLPILRGDRFVGRMDARLDKAKRQLQVPAVFAERNAPADSTVAADIREEIDRLAEFLGAESVRFGGKVPVAWKPSLH